MEKIKYPKLKLDKLDEKVTEIKSKQLTSVHHLSSVYTVDPYLSTLNVGEFSGFGYYLDGCYDWIVGFDIHDRKILLPLKKIGE